MADEVASLLVRINGDISGLEDAISDVSSQLSTLERSQGRSGAVSRTAQTAAADWQAAGKSIKSVGEGIDTVTKPIQYASTALAAGGVAAAKFAIDFEDSFASVKKTVEGTPQQLEDIKQSIIDMTTVGINGHSAIPMTTEQLNELAAAGGQLGISTDNIANFTETIAMLGTATNLNGEEGAATLAKFANVTKMSQDNFDRLGSSIVALGNNFATTEADIASMSMRLAGAGTQIGLNQADILGIATALSSVGIEAEMGGSAFSKAMIAMQMASSTGYNQVNDILSKTGMSLRDLQLLSANSSKDFKSLADDLGYTSGELNAVIKSGVQLENFGKITGRTAEEFKNLFDSNPAEAIDAFIKGLQNADSTGESAIEMLQDMGFTEVRLRDALLRLANSEAGVTDAVKMSNEAWEENVALLNEFETKAETTASKISVAKQNLVEAARSIGETFLPTIADASEGIAGFAQKLAGMDDESKKKLINTAGGIIALGAASKGIAVGTKYIGNFVEGIGKLAESAPAVSSALSSIEIAGAGVGSTLSALSPIFGALAAPAAVVAGYRIIAKYTTEAIENNSKLGQSYKSLYDELKDAENQAEHISALRDEYEKLNQSINSGDLTPEELEKAKSRTDEIMQEIKGLINDDTIKLMIDTGDYEAALDLAVADAQNAADEIRDALQIDNYKDARNAVEKAYDAVNKGGMHSVQYQEQRDSAKKWLQDAAAFEEQYNQIMDNMRKASETGNSNWLNSLAKMRNDLIKSVQENGFTDGYTALTGNDFKFDDMESVIAQIQNVRNAYKELSDGIDAADERAENGRKSLEAMAQVAQDSAIFFGGYKDIQEVFAEGGNAVNNTILQLKANMRDWGFENEDIAAQVALFRNGFSDLQGAINANALDAVVSDFVKEGQQLDITSGEIIAKAALMKNGFSDLQQAIASNDIGGVINDMGQLGTSMGMSVAQIDSFAHSIGLIPENKHIEFTENGFEIIEGAAEKLKEFENENIHISIDADGDIAVLNEATGRTQILKDIGAVNLTVNADGNIDVLDDANIKVAEINATTATITFTTEGEEKIQSAAEDVQQVPEDTEVTITATTTGKTEVDDLASAIDKVQDKEVTITATVVTNGVIPEAEGTSNFPGGLAMVNDDGKRDPRELIIDRGRAFIPEGRDVILPLSRGAKVYTSAQTKAIMSGLGIPRYAKGKNNSDAFTSARDNWTHYTKTHAVTSVQELEKWLELQKKYKSNSKDIADIEEQIFSIRQKITKELNDQSKAYIEERSALNDWDEYGDSASAAFERVKTRNKEALDAGRLTWEEYADNVSDIGKTLYDDKMAQSRKWLEHERKYNGMSAGDYVAGLKRMAQDTKAFYEQGIIDKRKFIEESAKIDEEYLDGYKEMLEEQSELVSRQNGISENWISERTHFNDWGDINDDPLAAYGRVKDRVLADLEEKINSGVYSEEEIRKMRDEVNEYLLSLGTDMHSGRLDQSNDWLDEQKKYFGMEADAYIAGLEREKAYTEQYYREGLIDAVTYHEALTDIKHKQWDEAEAAYEDMLSQQQKYISDMQEQFSKQEQALRDSWTIEDRKADISEVSAQLDIYAGAVTDRGQQKYKELQEQMKQLQRDEELYQLQVRNNDVIEQLQADYDAVEAAKTEFLRGIAKSVDVDISGIVADITSSINQSNNNVNRTLSEIIDAIHQIKIEQSYYNDNKQITNNFSRLTGEQFNSAVDDTGR